MTQYFWPLFLSISVLWKCFKPLIAVRSEVVAWWKLSRKCPRSLRSWSCTTRAGSMRRATAAQIILSSPFSSIFIILHPFEVHFLPLKSSWKLPQCGISACSRLRAGGAGEDAHHEYLGGCAAARAERRPKGRPLDQQPTRLPGPGPYRHGALECPGALPTQRPAPQRETYLPIMVI